MIQQTNPLTSRRRFLSSTARSLVALWFTSAFLQGCTALVHLINDHRKQNGLAEILISSSLMAVALQHVVDLDTYHPENLCAPSGNLHSWSTHGNWHGTPGKGAWKGCCYSGDHANAACMWEKPKEIANYPDFGYEIAHWESGTATAQSALASWKTSPPHNDVLLNKGIWQNRNWRALGVAWRGHYACAWFGEVQA
jgi:Cysteine-rich secretory protein family